jgi:serine phosphatase RsbU (regulator of sigma subunit)
MSEVRVALRAYALETEDPADLLTRLDQHVKHFQPRTMATVLCVMLTPGSDVARLSSAGHLPPVLVTPQAESCLVPLPPDLPVGVELGHPRRTLELDLTPGSVLCLYTDGLVERRNLVIDVNIDEVCRAVSPQSPELVCIDVMRKLVGTAVPDDDIAVLVVRRHPDAHANAERPAVVSY